MKSKVYLLLLFLVTKYSFSQTANFAADRFSGCAPIIVQFTDLSSGATTWNWTFGNGNTSTLANPAATYTNPGTYNVLLTINKGTAGERSITKTITVFKNPVADFTANPSPACWFDPILFTDNSILGDAPIKIWYWDFGDGNTFSDTINSTVHAFSNNATYPVSMTAVDTNGCSSVKIVNISVLICNGVEETENIATVSFAPNPYTNKTTISYSLKSQTDVLIEVYSAVGQKILTLNDAKQAQGEYKLAFSAKEMGYSDGVYFVKVKMNEQQSTYRIIEMK